MSDPTSQAWFDIETLVSASSPDSVLVVGPSVDGVLTEYRAQRQLLGRTCRFEFVHRDRIAESLPTLGRFDAGIVFDTLEYLDKQRGGQLIARLRDLHTLRFCLLAPVGDDWEGLRSTWRSADFLSYGMKLVNRYQTPAGTLHLYKYDIASYKSTPDWLSARDWANPELWNKYRW